MVFGATVSGRPPQLPGIESMIGLFINTMPVRVAPGLRARPWRDLLRPGAGRAGRAARAPPRSGLTEIQHAAGPGAELFDTLTVFESYPIGRQALARTAERACGSNR